MQTCGITSRIFDKENSKRFPAEQCFIQIDVEKKPFMQAVEIIKNILHENALAPAFVILGSAFLISIFGVCFDPTV